MRKPKTKVFGALSGLVLIALLVATAAHLRPRDSDQQKGLVGFEINGERYSLPNEHIFMVLGRGEPNPIVMFHFTYPELLPWPPTEGNTGYTTEQLNRFVGVRIGRKPFRWQDATVLETIAAAAGTSANEIRKNLKPGPTGLLKYEVLIGGQSSNREKPFSENYIPEAVLKGEYVEQMRSPIRCSKTPGPREQECVLMRMTGAKLWVEYNFSPDLLSDWANLDRSVEQFLKCAQVDHIRTPDEMCPETF